MIEKIQKRNGQMVAFDSVKILNAISRANMAVEDEVMDPADLSYLTQKVCSQLNPDEVVTGTVKELAEKYGQDVMTMVGFLDGINDSLKTANPIETMEEDTVVSLAFDKELLYKNMIDAKADWLYGLPQWDKIFDAETKKRLYREQKQSGTVRKAKKIGRNDPCPCGSGKKYKFCCGKNA